MTETDNTDPDYIPDEDIEIIEEEAVETDSEPSSPKKGLGLIPVVGLSLLAAILGAVGGAYGARYLSPPPDLSALEARVNKDISATQTETQRALNAIKNDVVALQGETANADQNTQQNEAIQKAMITIADRIDALESAPAPSFPKIDADTLAALKAAQKDGFKWPDTTALETQVTGLLADTDTLTSEIETLKQSVTTLETAPQVMAAAAPSASIGPEFPKQALLTAAHKLAEQQGFISRTLSKHISVESPDSPAALINKIETAYNKGDVYTAIKTFDRLPSGIRTAGQDWRDAAERIQ